jgi:DNA-binding LytR/AlgR family response regulator
MKIKCIIIDDESLAISVIESHLTNFDIIELVGTFTNPLKAYEIIEREKIDLVFLDINMPQLNGLDFIGNLNHKLTIVITTAYREYAVKSYELNVLDYLVKPISFDRFLKTINKVYQQIYISNTTTDINIKQEPYIFLKANKKLIKVNLNDIIYIESLKDYVKVSTQMGDYVVHKSLTALTEELPNTIFIRIHRSFTISINKVIAIDGNLLELLNKKIPIGRNYIKQTKERILNNNIEN